MSAAAREYGTQPLPESPYAAQLRQRFDLTGSDLPGEAAALSFEATALIGEICDALEAGLLHVAERGPDGAWTVHGWIKRALLTLGGAGEIRPQTGALPGTEITTLGWSDERSVRSRVPGGSYLRRGCFLGAGCSVMPPSTVQAGACVASGARVDSHVLVGSCAQIGEDVVLGCGTMIGGVLLPEEALPVVLERGVIVGGNCGIYGSVLIGEQAVLRPGTILQAADGVYDATRGEWITAERGRPLHIPAAAEIAMGVPPVEHCPGGLQRLTPMILARESRSY